MKLPFKLTRRRFLIGAGMSVPAGVLGNTLALEPNWLRVETVRLAKSQPTHRFVHFTDLHHKGDRKLLQSVVDKINALSPDFVCFTGDLVEEPEHVAESLEVLRTLRAPLYGVPGNHDYWANVDFKAIAEAFRATGGAWLMDSTARTADGKITISGLTCQSGHRPEPVGNTRNILLVHYPAWMKRFDGLRFDVTLAGHSHGGQIRLPLYGPLFVPWGVDEYDWGLFETKTGPLYVNAGIGWFYLSARFRCRPEITVVEM
jgi:predicted MPP superfamily phosphohydrolase